VGSRITITGAGEAAALVLRLFAGPVLGYVPGGDERGFPTCERNRTAWRALPDDDQRSRNCIRKTDPPGSRQAYPWAVSKKRPRPPKWIDGSSKCSFCGKAKSEVGSLIAGPGVYICNECVGLCNEIIAEEQMPAR
jgi:hypothetical protein